MLFALVSCAYSNCYILSMYFVKRKSDIFLDTVSGVLLMQNRHITVSYPDDPELASGDIGVRATYWLLLVAVSPYGRYQRLIPTISSGDPPLADTLNNISDNGYI